MTDEQKIEDKRKRYAEAWKQHTADLIKIAWTEPDEHLAIREIIKRLDSIIDKAAAKIDEV